MNQLQTAVVIQKPGEPEPAPRNFAVPLPIKDALFLCIVAVLIWRGSLGLSLVAGMIFALTLGHPRRKGGNKISKWLFQSCVVLLGFGMDLEKVLRAGMSGFLFAAVSITGTLAIGLYLGRLLGIGTKISALIASGTATRPEDQRAERTIRGWSAVARGAMEVRPPRRG